MMTNRDFIKQLICEKIEILTDEELYEITSDHLIPGKMCKHCELYFGPCDDDETEIKCKERFADWLEMTHTSKSEDVDIKEDDHFEFAQIAEYLDGKALIVYDTQNEMYFGLGQCHGWTEYFEGMTFERVLEDFKNFVVKKMIDNLRK